MKEISHAWKVLSAQIDKGLMDSSAKHYRALLNAYTREAKAQLISLERAIAGPIQRALTAVDTRLANARQRLATITQNYNQLRSSVSGAVGGFDITPAGTFNVDLHRRLRRR